MKRMIRGMLPWDRTRGREAYKRLRCYLGNGDLTEEEVKLAKSIEVKMPIKYIQLKELGELI
jgi:large subunit ribosomal protein L13